MKVGGGLLFGLGGSFLVAVWVFAFWTVCCYLIFGVFFPKTTHLPDHQIFTHAAHMNCMNRAWSKETLKKTLDSLTSMHTG